MKELLFKNWHLLRFFRLALALFLFQQAYETRQWFFIVFGLFFLAQAVLNLGCGPSGCSVDVKNKKQK